MTDRRTIFIGKKPLHAYVRAVVMAMESGDRNLELVARGATIGLLPGLSVFEQR